MCERRSNPDRREEPNPWQGALPPAGRRGRVRRAEEADRPYFLDRFSWGIWVFVLLLIAATLVDGLITIELIHAGGREINPVMRRLLEHGPLAFIAGKYLLTVAGLPVLLVLGNFFLFGTRLRVRHLIPLVVALYAVLITYQIVLLHRC